MRHLQTWLSLAVFFIFALTASFGAGSEGFPHLTHASWYGPGFFGRTMKCGKRYAKDAVFVAHRTYPIGTKLRIVNLYNHRSIIVPVEDRGPYIDTKPGEERDLDLSYEAARRLDMLQAGVVLVSYSKVIAPSSEGDVSR